VNKHTRKLLTVSTSKFVMQINTEILFVMID